MTVFLEHFIIISEHVNTYWPVLLARSASYMQVMYDRLYTLLSLGVHHFQNKLKQQ
jgi:hypothetical protein